MKFFAAILILFSLAFVHCGNSVDDSATDTVVTSDADLKKFPSYIRDSVATVDTLEIHFYIPVNAIADMLTVRPLKSDTGIVFAAAAAFTRLDNGRIDGLFLERGQVITRPVNKTLGGGIVIPHPDSLRQPDIFGTEMGTLLDSAFVDSIAAINASFFQEIQMVRDGQSLVFRKDVSRFQRRAICIYKGEAVIVESTLPCTLQKFADVLKACGIPNALYLDGGSWDEGWFLDEFHERHTIGLLRNETDRQSNWIVFRAVE